MKFTLFLILIVAQTCLAEEISFDYKNTSQTATILFTDDLVVRVSNVNTVDYKYTIKVEGVEGIKRDGPFPGFPDSLGLKLPMKTSGILKSSNFASDTVKGFNKWFGKRMASFSKDEWNLANGNISGLVTQFSGTGKVDLKNNAFIPEREEPGFFTLTIYSADLLQAARKAGKGGVVFIEITASPIVKKAELGPGSKTITIRESLKAMPDSEVALAHMKTRIFRINLENPSRLQFTLGPFMANIRQTKYGKVLSSSSGSDPRFQVGETESGNWVWGLAGIWNARANSFKDEAGVGFQMGFALAEERELDKSVLGLLGIFVSPGNNGNFFLSAGVAGGIEEKLGGDWKINDLINSDQELPVVKNFVVKPYAAVTFAF